MKRRPRVEVYPLAKIEEACARMTSNKARFRVVLKMESREVKK
jgi:D-arabinose 1-dehydrogenase-like Zn-dependent alcohol dehydrogenase